MAKKKKPKFDKAKLVKLFPRTIVLGNSSIESDGETRCPTFFLLSREQFSVFRSQGEITVPTAVIEVLGNHIERHFLQGQELRRFYAQKNMACLVLWEDDLLDHFEEVEGRVRNYVSKWRRGFYNDVKDHTPGITIFDLFNPGEIIRFEGQVIVRATPDVIKPKKMNGSGTDPLLTVLNFSGGKQSSVLLWMVLRGDLPLPPRSVCNACWANGLDTFKTMYEERPHDWDQAVLVDRAVRDLSQIMVQEEIFVSRTCIPLEDLPKINFQIKAKKEDGDQWSCDSGYCFV